jgi:hypothetical protein
MSDLSLGRRAAAGRWWRMGEPFLSRDYTGWWRLPPARWPRVLVWLIVGEIVLAIGAGL